MISIYHSLTFGAVVIFAVLALVTSFSWRMDFMVWSLRLFRVVPCPAMDRRRMRRSAGEDEDLLSCWIRPG